MNDISYKFLFKFLDDIINNNEAFDEIVTSDISQRFHDSFLYRLTSFKETEDKLFKIDNELAGYFNTKTLNLVKKYHNGNIYKFKTTL